MSVVAALLDGWTVLLVCAGIGFFVAGTTGMLRFPDAATRLHALTKADNLGVGLVVLGLLPQVARPAEGFKLLVIWALVLLASAVSSQLVARVATDGPPIEEDRNGRTAPAASGTPLDRSGSVGAGAQP
ncbi:MAG TPA: monovalent cation/H(+) antiporter subunit G [Phycisphaerales bacterium]|nr:monovalent cation/H(+) antiporter subunit G [Phycisphaerales bacterium]HMP36687.1 monovalent cation/H(+) antiporter subunit G [Phycisphaerales bacterium]